MPYSAGANVRLTREVQVTAGGAAAGAGSPGALFLAEGLVGIVTGVANEARGAAQAALAEFDQQVRGSHFSGFTAHVVDGLRQQIIQQGAFDTGAGARAQYRVRFENGFVLDGLDEDCLTAI
ncbi:hypothetical protein [Kitasatospora sp. NPDC056184]|uniref:hypothetical protein n=1 Tax=Kitasatospora sp. NPDC056184 TaxID=3345738 RepID=UPI0035D95076